MIEQNCSAHGISKRKGERRRKRRKGMMEQKGKKDEVKFLHSRPSSQWLLLPVRPCQQLYCTCSRYASENGILSHRKKVQGELLKAELGFIKKRFDTSKHRYGVHSLWSCHFLCLLDFWGAFEQSGMYGVREKDQEKWLDSKVWGS